MCALPWLALLADQKRGRLVDRLSYRDVVYRSLMFFFAAAFDVFLRLQVANLGAFFIFLNHLFSIISLLSCRSLVFCLPAAFLPGLFSWSVLFWRYSFWILAISSSEKPRTAKSNHKAALLVLLLFVWVTGTAESSRHAGSGLPCGACT
jgi:hypothetical protein